ncbi:hypothetical protein HDU96_003794 [Phlyctochytrium bullatum]|nr:hypothetical protein HDU96_003794 [Phlyctochytrium bullatum]
MLSFKTLAFAASLLAASAAAQSSKIVFDKTSLEIEDANGGAELSVSLAEAPSSVATVYLEAPGLQLSDCKLSFDKDNFKTPKKIRVIGGGSDKATSFTLNAQIFSPNSGINLAKGSVSIKRKPIPAANCFSTGDPHYKTFDGKYYSAQGEGTYYLVKSSQGLVIQTDQKKCAPGVTCNNAVAIQYGSSVVTLTPASKTDYTKLKLNLLTKSSEGISASGCQDASQFQLNLADGSVVTASIHPWNNVYYIDVAVTIAGIHRGKTDGLCGSFNGNANDDAANPGGYNVPSHENIFTTGKGINLSVAVPPVSQVCKIPQLGSDSITGGDSGSVVYVPGSLIPISINVPSADAVKEYVDASIEFAAKKINEQLAATRVQVSGNMAATYCAAIREADASCNTVVDVNYFVGACAADLAMSGDLGTVAKVRKAFLSACASRITCDSRFESDANAAMALFNKASNLFRAIQEQASAVITSVQGQTPVVQVPQIQVPQVQIPQVQIPRVQIPIPQVQIPQVHIPQIKLPQVQIPQMQVPNMQMPAWGQPQGYKW